MLPGLLLLLGLLFSAPAWVLRYRLFKCRTSILFAITYALLLYFVQSIVTTVLFGMPSATGFSVPMSVVILRWKPREYGPDNPDYYEKRHYPGERGL